MEAVGLIASAAQISVYAFSIASTIQDIRSAIRNGPTLLQERSQQLDVLSLVVRKIGLDTRLHSDEVARYLVTVQSKILRLNNIIRAGLQTPTKSFLQKLRAATTFINRDKEVEDSFTALQRDCQILNIYVSLPSSTSGGGQRRDISGIISAVENPSVSSQSTSAKMDLADCYRTRSRTVSLLSSRATSEPTLCREPCRRRAVRQMVTNDPDLRQKVHRLRAAQQSQRPRTWIKKSWVHT